MKTTKTTSQRRRDNDPSLRSNDDPRRLTQLEPGVREEYMAAQRQLVKARDAGQFDPRDFGAANNRLFDAYHGTPRNQAWIAAARPARFRRSIHTA